MPVQQHVLRLHVAVHDLVRVGVSEGAGEVGEQGHGAGDLVALEAALALEQLSQAVPLDVLHDEVEQRVHFAGRVHGDDVRMAELGDRARLPQEALSGGWGRGEIGRDDLDRDRPVERNVSAEEHLPHPAGAELPLDVIPCRRARRGACGAMAGLENLARGGAGWRGGWTTVSC